MKAGILYGDREIRTGTAPGPRILPNEVRVRPEAAGICGTDVHLYRGEFHDRVTPPVAVVVEGEVGVLAGRRCGRHENHDSPPAALGFR